MPDVDELIRDELTRVVDRTPIPPSVDEIVMPRATAPRRRPRAMVAVAAALTATVAIAGATVVVVAGRDGDERDPGQLRATAPGPAFAETIDWPHYLATTPPGGADLQLVQEIRPGGLQSWTTQSWRVGDAGGSILLVVQPLPGDSGDGPLDGSGETVQGHPITWLDDQNAANQATWSWPGAQVLVYINGLTREEATSALAKLVPRDEGLAAQAFNGPSDGSMTITNEHFAEDGQPAIARSWYGNEGRTDYEVQAVAPIVDRTPTLDLVSLGGNGTDRRTVAGHDALVATFGAWTTAAWFDTDGTFLTLQARDVDDDELEALVDGIHRVDQPTWDAAVADMSDRISARGTGAIEFREFSDGRLVAHGGRDAAGEVIGADLCLELDGHAPRCAANLGRRDGGPYVVGPSGLLSWTPMEVGSTVADFVVDGEWWVAGRLPRSQDPVVDIGSGPVEIEVFESGGATWFLARMPNDVDRYTLTFGGRVTGGWRPSSGR